MYVPKMSDVAIALNQRQTFLLCETVWNIWVEK